MKEQNKLSRRKFLGVAGASTPAAGTKIAGGNPRNPSIASN